MLSVEKHIVIGAEEGVYSLNFSENLHEAEMEQVAMSLHHAWVHVMKLQKQVPLSQITFWQLQ